MKYEVEATRTYYSVIHFEVEAESYEEARSKAESMIDNNVVEFDGIDNCDDDDLVEVYPMKEEDTYVRR